MLFRTFLLAAVLLSLPGCFAQYARKKCVDEGYQAVFPNQQACLIYFENQQQEAFNRSMAQMQAGAQQAANATAQQQQVYQAKQAQNTQLLEMYNQRYLQSQAFAFQSLLQHQQNLADQTIQMQRSIQPPSSPAPIYPNAVGGCGAGQVMCCRRNPIAIPPIGGGVPLTCSCQATCF